MEDASILFYLKALRKRWLLLFLFTAASGAAGLFYAFTTPKVYKAVAQLYVFGGSIKPIGISQILMSMTGAGGTGQPDYLEKLLTSDTVALAVAEKLRLHTVAEFYVKDKKEAPKTGSKAAKRKKSKKSFEYDLRNPEAQKLLLKLKDQVEIRYDKKAAISIACESQNRNVAANIVNSYVTVLRSKMTSKSSKNVKFLKRQLDKIKRDLSSAEDTLRSFQEDQKIMVLDKQLEEEVTKYLDLKKDHLTNKMSLDATQKLIQSSGSLDDLARLEGEKILYETRQTELETALQQFDASLESYPEKAQQFARLVREVKVQELIYQLLAQQYEMERISQLREDVDFQVIDKAYPPEKHFKPRKKIVLLISLAAGFFGGVFLVLFAEIMKSQTDNERQSA